MNPSRVEDKQRLAHALSLLEAQIVSKCPGPTFYRSLQTRRPLPLSVSMSCGHAQAASI